MISNDNLEEFQDPENYDLEEAAAAGPRADFYGDLAERAPGPVLELACGTGLLAMPIARRGLAVTGSDISPAMLAHARRKSASEQLAVDWVEADARDIDLGRCFGLVYLTGNAFQAFLQREDQERLLASVARHLQQGGQFAFETRNPSGHDLYSIGEEQAWFRYVDLRGREVGAGGTQRYDALGQIMHWSTVRRWHDGREAREHRTRIACRFTWPQELAALMHYNGFRIAEQFGDFQRGTLTAGSESIISVCERR